MQDKLPVIEKGGIGPNKPIQLTVSTLEPITEAGRYKIQGSSVFIQNVGDEIAYINRNFQIGVGAGVTLQTGQDYNYILDVIHLSFAGGGVDPRLEIIELRPVIKGYGEIISR